MPVHRLLIAAALTGLTAGALPTLAVADDNGFAFGSLTVSVAPAPPSQIASATPVAKNPSIGLEVAGVETNCPQVLTNPGAFDASSIQLCTTLRELIAQTR